MSKSDKINGQSADSTDLEISAAEHNRGLGFSGSLIFLCIVALDSIRIYYSQYTPYDRFATAHSLLMGSHPAVIFWIVAAADLLGMFLFARILIPLIPSATQKTRWMSVIIGLPLALAGVNYFDYSTILLIEHLQNSERLLHYMWTFIASGIIAAAGVALLTALGLTEGSGKMGGAVVSVFVRVLALAVLTGILVVILRQLSFFLYALPMLGLPLRAGFNLWLVLWFFKNLARMIKTDLPAHPPAMPPFPVAIFHILLTLILAGLSLVVPGPAHHLDTVDIPELVPNDPRISLSGYDTRGESVLVTSEKLSIIIHKKPFAFAVIDKDKKVSLKLFTDPRVPADYRGVALNREYRALYTNPLLGPGRLLKSRLLVNSINMAEADDIRHSAGEVIVEGKVMRRPIAVTFSFHDEDVLKITVDAGSRSAMRSTSIAFSCGKKERIMGRGNGSGDIELRGMDLDMVVEQDGHLDIDPGRLISKLTKNRMSVSMGKKGNGWPIPFVILGRGVGIFLAETADPRIELADRYSDVIRFSGRGGPLNLYLITGASPFDIIQKFNRLTGQKAQLPPSALVPWISMSAGEVKNMSIEKQMADIRRLKIPLEFIHIGREDIPGGKTFYAGLKKTLERGKKTGFKFIYDDRVRLRKGTDEYREAVEGGYVILNRMGLPYNFQTMKGSWALIDFTNPEAVKWRGGYWKRMKEAGFSGLVLDANAMIPPESVLYNGESGYALRNLYPLVYAKAVAEVLGEDAIIASPIGFAGIERFVSVAWQAKSTEDAGIGNELSRILAMGMSGAPATLSTTASAPASSAKDIKNLGSVSPIMVLPPGLGRMEKSDKNFVRSVRELAEMHTRLFPYLYSLAIEEAQEGVPVMRHLSLAWPGESDFYEVDDQFMLGDALLVAPLPAGKRKRLVSFPAGKWLHLETHKMYGEGEVEVVSAKGKPHIFLSRGHILPLFAEPFHTFSGQQIEGVVKGSLDSNLTLLWISGPAAAFSLYDGGMVTSRRVAESILLRSSGGKERSYTWRIFNCDPPLALFANGIRLENKQWDYQERSRVLTIPDLPGPGLEVEVVLKDFAE